MIVDGKAIAREILAEVAAAVKLRAGAPRLTVFTCAPNFETQKFLHLKQRRAAEAGIVVELVTLDEGSTTDTVVANIRVALPQSEGIIVQLPFPPHIDMAVVLDAVPSTHDVDALRYNGEVTEVLPPVVGAIDAIAARHDVSFVGKAVVVIGQGRLVGAPAAAYARTQGGEVTVVVKDTEGAAAHITAADILILGAGVPGLITADQVKSGVVIFDAGTSEEGGMLVGDAEPGVATVASVLTPVPGGIGPITIAILLQNLVRLSDGG